MSLIGPSLFRGEPRGRLLAGPIHIRIEVGENAIKEGEIFFILGGLRQARGIDLAQESNRVMTESLPKSIVKTTKQARCFGLPGPPQVVRQLTEAGETCG